MRPFLLAAVIVCASACKTSSNPAPDASPTPDRANDTVDSSDSAQGLRDTKDVDDPGRDGRVTAVRVGGQAGAYQFSVTLLTPDSGCDQYADWWEVVTPDGELIHRRILAHSHVDEQPFTRSGGPVDVTEDQAVIVRVHLNPLGYSALAMRGSAAGEFQEVALDPGFAAELENAAPQPDGCAF